MKQGQNRPHSRIVGFLLEAGKLFGIALAALFAIGAVVIASAKTGIAIPARWTGLFFWTCALLWFVFKQHSRDLRYGRFWLAFSAILMAHLTAFAFVLK